MVVVLVVVYVVLVIVVVFVEVWLKDDLERETDETVIHVHRQFDHES